MEDSPTTSRAKRIKIDKSNRSAAFQKLKELKGSKNKYQIEKLENVYDQVDEKEYSKTVANRQQSDWIVDDGENGYVEDGREIFDDDLDDESIQKESKRNLSGPRKRKREKDDESSSKGSIVSMFKKCEKKKDSVKAENENLLSDILNEFKKNTSSSDVKKTTPTVNKFKVQSKPPVPQQDLSAIPDQSKNVPETQINNDNDDDLSIFDKNTPAAKVETAVTKSPSKKTEKIEENAVTKDADPIPDELKAENEVYFEEYDFGNDDFDISLEAKNAENSSKGNRPKIEDDDFNKVIASLDDKSLWLKWDEEENAIVKKPATGPAAGKTDMPSSSQLEENKKLLESATFKNSKGEDVIRFYWWDAVENPYKSPGVVNLFGKIYIESTKSYMSCCLTVRNIPRRLYVLPREEVIDAYTDSKVPVTMEDVYKDFKNLAELNEIHEFRSMVTTKSYAFDRSDTPLQSEYLEVRYSASHPPVEPNCCCYAIEHIFGGSVNALELLLVERKIKGPNWLDIKSPSFASGSATWCKLQVECHKMENIAVTDNDNKLKIPPIVLMTIDVRTTLNSRNNETEITMIGILINNNYSVDKPSPKTIFNKNYCLVTHPKDTNWPLYARDKLPRINKDTNIVICETETDILEKLLDIIDETDPDLLLGYDCGFQFDTIYRRLVALKIKNLSRISKLKHNIAVKFSGGNKNYKLPISSIFSGRPIVDIVAAVKELNIKMRTYDLDTICSTVMKTKENTVKEIKPSECSKFYESVDRISTLINVTMSEALCISTLIFQLNVIPLALQITCIAGNVLSKTLSGGRAERNEFLLLHAFSEKGYITPDKKGKQTRNPEKMTNASKKPKYAGGLVLDPKKGFYDKFILLMDFNSLYPSIIQEFNLCFTTLKNICILELEQMEDINDCLPKPDAETGVIPTEIRKLVESRRQVKNLMKQQNLSPELKMNYNIRQLALKLTANSMYGCLGATHSRFYAKTFAAIITSKGREILEHTKNLVENLKFEVIYGDTDSLMINSECVNYEKAFEIAKTIKSEVNKHYKMLELDIDGVFKNLLLLQKKKYAAVIVNKLPNGEFEFNKEYKGLDIVRRDWCQLACETGTTILELIFKDCTEEEKLVQIGEALKEVSSNVRNNKLPLTSFVMTKQLSKNPNDYPNKNAVHVAIALRMNKAGGRMWKSGDTISFLICNDGTQKQPPERSYHIDEFKKNKSLSIDCDYYLYYQVLPVISRICGPIQMITEEFLIDNLGLGELYQTKHKAREPAPSGDYRALNSSPDKLNNKNRCDKDLYKNCKPFKIYCLKCNAYNEIKEFTSTFSHGTKPSFAGCTGPDCNFIPFKYPNVVYCAIIQNIREVIQQYYRQNFICINSKCRKTQRKIIIGGQKQMPICIYCGRSYLYRTYTDAEVFDQLKFFQHLFDDTKITERYPTSSISNHNEMIDVYKSAKKMVEDYICRNRYSTLNFADLVVLFKRRFKKKKYLDTVVGNKDFKKDQLEKDENVKYQSAFEASKQDGFYNKVVFW